MTHHLVSYMIPSVEPIRAILDTNIILAALYSSNGASNALIKLVRDGIVTPCVSVTLVLEYEDVLTRQKKLLQIAQEDIKAYLGFLVRQSEKIKIYYLWRPHLKDPKDDMVLEVAVSAGAEFIVTHNIKDFKGSEQFGIQAVTPGWFVKNIGGMK